MVSETNKKSNLETLKILADDWDLKHRLFRKQLTALHLAYIHAITQSGYKLEFYEDGGVKSIAPKGESE